MEIIYNVAENYGKILGGRWRRLGPKSGEDFYESVLEPAFKKAKENNDSLKFMLDGTTGYPSSFLDQSFGELARNYGVDEVRKVVTFETKVFQWVVDYINRQIWDKSE
ncbi:MAG: STAS-like domain-containing protein [Lachnospiraceae bacterium]|nr:STAS-like domain-containing protein [Lachnospiraceae bacterium]